MVVVWGCGFWLASVLWLVLVLVVLMKQWLAGKW